MEGSTNKPFIKFMRNSNRLHELLRTRPTAYCLLTLIAERARRTDEERFDNLQIGEALVGDYDSYGVTRQVYRDDLAFLMLHQFITTKRTNKGTIAMLCDDSIFDINPETKEPTKEPKENQQRTTNKNVKNVKNNTDSQGILKTVRHQCPTENRTTNSTKTVRHQRPTKDTHIEGNTYTRIEDLTQPVLSAVAKEYRITSKQAEEVKEDLRLYVEGNPRNAAKYKNYKAVLQTWIRREIKRGSIKPQLTFREQIEAEDPEAAKNITWNN